MLHQFTYVSYETVSKGTSSENKLYHHVQCTFDDDLATFTAKHVGDTLGDAKLVPFAQPKDISIPETMELRLEAGNEQSDVVLDFPSALMVAQFRIWLSGQVATDKSVSLTDDQIKAGLAKMSERDAMKAEVILEHGSRKAKAATVEQIRKLIA